MNFLSHLQLMAQYNQGMNQKVYAACATLSPEALAIDRQAFFGSILGTLNHLMVADLVWLQRFANHPANDSVLEPIRKITPPQALNQMLYQDFTELYRQRQLIDRVIIDWIANITENDLDQVLAYQNMKGVPARRPIGLLLCHFFNHQTHHRGQLSALLSQAGLDIGVTDLLEIIPQV